MTKIKETIKNFFQNKENIFNLFLFVLLTAMCYFFPYAHDDWAWGTSIGIERLTALFKDYNGRWCGNLLVLLLTRNRIVRALVISITLTLIVYFIHKISNYKKTDSIMIMFLLSIMPISIFAQGIAWTAGFSNYVPPILFILIYIYLNKKELESKTKENKLHKLILIALMGFITSLFVEHVTIYNIILSLFLVVIFYIKEKKLSKLNIYYFIGSLMGTILMFSNGAYHNIANSSDGYRTIEQGNIIIRSINVYVNELSNLLINNNTLLNIIISILCIILISKYLKNTAKRKKFKTIIANICSLIFCGVISYNIYTKVMDGSNIFIYGSYKTLLEACIATLFIISTLTTIMMIVTNKEQRNKLMFIALSIALMAAPLLVVTPIGPRCFVPTYVFFVWFTYELAGITLNKNNVGIKNCLQIITLFLILCNTLIYVYSFKIEFEREKYIENNNTKKELVLPNITHTRYSQYPNPANETFMTRFKLYYNIDEETNVSFIDYKTWVKKYK